MNNEIENNAQKGKLDLKAMARLLLAWKKFLAFQFVLISITAVIIALIIPKTYSSSATLLAPDGSSFLSSFLPSGMTQGLGSVLGASGIGMGEETDKILAILNSRNIAEKTIDKFDLKIFYEIDLIEDAIKKFRKNVSVSVDEESSIRVTASFKTDFFYPKENEERIKIMSKKVCDYVIAELDNIYTNLGTQKARYQREVIQKRYDQNLQDIKQVELDLKSFSETNNLVSLPNQTEAMIKVLAEIEGRRIIEEIQLEVLKNTYSNNSQEVINKQNLISELNNKINQLKSIDDVNAGSNSVFPSFNETPELALQYARLHRRIAVENIIYEFLTQQLEQLMMQEAKDTPSIQFIDTPQYPTKRSAPSRALTVIIIVLCGGILSISYVLVRSLYAKEISEFINDIKS